MRSSLIFILIFTIVFSTSYWYVSTANICPIPITYRLGDIDSRFAITATEAKTVLADAEAMWENAVLRDLFIYDETSTFSLNFIYDERQQLASTEEEWRIALDQKEAESREILEQVKVQAAQHELLQNAYAKDRERYEALLRDYNQDVARVNEAGGAGPEEFASLQARQKDLNSKVVELARQEKELNEMAAAINTEGERGNRLIENYNAEVLRYNQVYGNLDVYTQGDFRRDRINIYKFSDTEELTRVVAHEFGHALGIGHVEGEDSVMYYLMTEQTGLPQLSSEDKAAFFSVCGEGKTFSQSIRQLIRNTLAKIV